MEGTLKQKCFVGLFLMASWVSAVCAQQSEGNLTAQQQRGRLLLAQSCGVCHLQASMNAKTYGPPLNKASANGNSDIMRTFIMEGTPRMPAFKYHFKSADVDAIIDYVKTVPASADTAAAR